MNPDDFIAELPENEAEWWSEKIKEFRTRLIKEPKEYAKLILDTKNYEKEELIDNLDQAIEQTREKIWQLYLIDEAEFHKQVLLALFRERGLPRNILNKLVERELVQSNFTNLEQDELVMKVSEIVGEYAGRIMPYIYQLSLSTTQSRRARSGKTFEHLVETVMDILELPYDTQSSVGTDFFEENGIGKKVDLLVPGAQEYIRNRSKSALVTAKTSLRERWQEVAEEISRTNVPHIYLLTVDRNLSENTATIISRYNITLVVYGDVKSTTFSNKENVIGFKKFFTIEIPHIVGYWQNKDE